MSVKNRSRQDLRLQLLALYLLFVIPIFILTLFFYAQASQRLRDDVRAADLSLARAIALETDAMLLKAKEAVVAFSQMSPVIQNDPVGMENAFAAGAAARQDINLFYRLDADGIMRYHYPASPRSTVGQDFSFRDYFQVARQTQQHVFSKGRISPTTERPVATSVMPVFINGHFDGVVATNLELQRLTETIKQIGQKQSHSSEGVKIIIVDSANQVIAHSEPNNLLKNVSDTLPGLSQVLAGQEGSLITTDQAGEEWLYTYTPVTSAGWGVIVQHSSRLAFASLVSLQRVLLLALVIFGLGAFFFWVFLSRRVIDPLERLTDYGEGVGRETGQLEPDHGSILPISQRLDQIGSLTRAILRAEHHIRQRLLELTTLNKTSTAVISTLDTQQVFDSILNEVQQLLSVRQCALFTLNESTQQLEMQASRGLPKTHPAKMVAANDTGPSPIYRAIRAGEPVQIADIKTETAAASLLTIANNAGFRSILVMPITAPHISPAALCIYRPDIHHFSQREIDLVTSFANQAAIALEHATLFGLTDAELQKQVRFLSALNRVGRTVSQSLVVDDVLNNAMAEVFEVMPADACWIYLQREGEDFLRLRAQRGFSDGLAEQVRGQRVKYGQGITGKVAQSSRPLLLDTAQLQPDDKSDETIITGGDWKSLAVAPLLAKDTFIGVLGMATRSDRAFSKAEAELLQAIGNQIALAIVNARLYRRSHEVATLEERNRLAREIHDTLAQGFTGILIQLQAAERLSLKYPEKAVESLQEARELARESLQEARRSVFNLRPTVLEEVPLDRAISHQVHRLEAESGLKAEFTLVGYPSPLNAGLEQNLYRITQEALTNVHRHAQAKHVSVTLTFEPKEVALTITDDGIGLNGRNGSNSRNNSDQAKAGFGLVGIQERVSLMNGQVTFENPAGGGTQIKVVIPK